jgi:uncharacterized protein YyaL (SSP411 family)
MHFQDKKGIMISMKRITGIFFCCLLAFSPIAGANEFRFSPRPNRAHLIQWRGWSADALSEARTKDRLILLSLSAVWCHWCHVMDETTYSDDEVISFINANFIPIRVDADMRPDIDTLYNQGGWPSTAILTPEGEVISGGNYLEPEELLGRLKRALALYRSDRKSISRRIDEMKALKAVRRTGPAGVHHLPGRSDIDDIVRVLDDAFDETYGGFGSGQKFPNPDAIDFLISLYAKNHDRRIRHIVTTTLDRMARGGLFDHGEGGFFRYATKPDWSGPHYEKMLEVNAGMIRNYADAGRMFGKRAYLAIVRKTINYIEANLSDPATGAFFGSQDADEQYYGGKKRNAVQPPAVDKTVYSDSSSLVISALVSAYGATGRKEYLDRARACADFLLRNLYSDREGIYHFYRGGVRQLPGMLSDNALFGAALLDLYDETGNREYEQQARETGRLLVGRFFDAEGKRFRSSQGNALTKPAVDSALLEINENLANYRALRFLSRLAYYGAIDNLQTVRDAAILSLSREYRKFAPHAGAFGGVLLWTAVDPVQITILVGKNGAQKYLDAIRDVSIPEKTVRVLLLSADAGEIKKLGYAPRESVYLCAGKRCSKPIVGIKELIKSLQDFTAVEQRR